MGARRTRERITRLWRIIEVLHSRRRGMRIADLIDRVAASRATLYRDLQLLEEAGVPLQRAIVNGEARVMLDRHPLPALAPTSKQHIALQLARDALAPLEGTSLVRELDALLSARARKPTGKVGAVKAAHRPDPTVVASVERAIDNGIRLRIRYRSASSRSTRWRLVDPATMRLADEHLYLVAWDVESSSPKTFKLTRILALEETTEPVATHPPLDLDQLFANAVRIWTADPVDVAVKIHDGLGWLVREWPLHAKQSVDDLPNGDAIVRARVAGIAEATRWTLRWGRSAEALEPASLLAAVQQELAGASARYKRPPKQVVSPTVRRAERIIANDPPVTSRRST